MKNKTNIENDLWIDKLKDRVNNHVEPLPPLGWEALEKELSPKKRFILLPRQLKNIAAAAVLLVALFGASLYFTHTPISNEMADLDMASICYKHDLSAIENSYKSSNNTNEPLTHETNVVANASPTKVARKTSQLSANKHNIPTESRCLETVSSSSDNDPIDAENTVIAQADVDNHEKKSVQAVAHVETSKIEEERRVRNRPSSKDKYHLPITQSNKQAKSKWSVGAAVNSAGLLAQNETSANFNGYRVASNISTSGSNDPEGNQTIFYKDGIAYVYNEQDIITTKHHQPITVGVSARKLLNHGLSVESGINFTLLSSEITFASNYTDAVKQKLSYIGIPLKLNWSFVNSRYFTLYVSAGGQIEKCVHGKIGDMKISAKPWQFSVLGGIGAQFNITKHFGLYAEPGLAYFFDNNSNIQTIRKKHPLDFNLQGGIRFTY